MSAPVDMAAMLDYHEDMIDSAHPRPGMAYDPLVDLDPLVPPGPGATRRERMRWQRAQPAGSRDSSATCWVADQTIRPRCSSLPP